MPVALDAALLLERVATKVPSALREKVVVVGSIAAAWHFRDVSGSAAVATKDIDLLLRPSVDAVTTAQALGRLLVEEGWRPTYPPGWSAAGSTSPAERLPALRLSPPDGQESWFIELLAEAPVGQLERKHWARFRTAAGDFALPSFRFMRIAVHDPEVTPSGLRVARPASMALAHLLEHADPDRTPISGMEGRPPRFAKDVGRAVAMWWLAGRQTPLADRVWLSAWSAAAAACLDAPSGEAPRADPAGRARLALQALDGLHRDSHEIAVRGLLAPYQVSLEAWRRAHQGLVEVVDRWEAVNAPFSP